MKYKELLEQLNKLSPEQLECNVVCMSEENGYKISQIEILSKDLYTDAEYPEDGCFPLELGQDSDELSLIYPFGTPILIINQ